MQVGVKKLNEGTILTDQHGIGKPFTAPLGNLTYLKVSYCRQFHTLIPQQPVSLTSVIKKSQENTAC
jgi:hypothetical protein